MSSLLFVKMSVSGSRELAHGKNQQFPPWLVTPVRRDVLFPPPPEDPARFSFGHPHGGDISKTLGHIRIIHQLTLEQNSPAWCPPNVLEYNFHQPLLDGSYLPEHRRGWTSWQRLPPPPLPQLLRYSSVFSGFFHNLSYFSAVKIYLKFSHISSNNRLSPFLTESMPGMKVH